MDKVKSSAIILMSQCESVLHLPARCGLVALWMSAQLRQPHVNVDMETIVQTAVTRGYTAQGEMFSGIISVYSLCLI